LDPAQFYFHSWPVLFFMSAYSQVRDAVFQIQPKPLSERYSDKHYKRFNFLKLTIVEIYGEAIWSVKWNKAATGLKGLCMFTNRKV